MTPTKMTTQLNSAPTKSNVDIKVAEIRRRTSARYSILSDPRLSQLFALSSQLEALAQTIELEAATAVNIDIPTSDLMTSDLTAASLSPAPTCLTATSSPKPPELPPKPKFGSSTLNDRSNGNVVSKPRPEPRKSTEIRYVRLSDADDVINLGNFDYENLFEEEEEDEDGDREDANGPPPGLDLVPPPRYSTLSDSRDQSYKTFLPQMEALSIITNVCTDF